MISFDHCALAVSTSSTRCSSLTWLTRSIAGPTAAFQANVTLPSDSGEPRRSSTSAPGMPSCSGRIDDIRSYYCTVRLILASASPRRAELLRAAGYTFEILAADVDESVRPDESPSAYVRRLAADKSAAAQSSVVSGFSRADALSRERGPAKAGHYPSDLVILGADTTVVADSEILGKPRDDEDLRRMLQRLSGKTHQVLTGVSLRQGAYEVGRVETTSVVFRALTDEDMSWYVASGEGRDKAGGYAIQGLAARFIPSIAGSYSNVVGLPLACVDELLRSLLASRR
jgi:septum formation protein